MNDYRFQRMAFMLVTACALTAHGAEQPASKPNSRGAPNLEFLEYLGTLEGDEENWTDIAAADLPKRPAKQMAGNQKNRYGAERVPTDGAGQKSSAAAQTVEKTDTEK